MRKVPRHELVPAEVRDRAVPDLPAHCECVAVRAVGERSRAEGHWLANLRERPGVEETQPVATPERKGVAVGTEGDPVDVGVVARGEQDPGQDLDHRLRALQVGEQVAAGLW